MIVTFFTWLWLLIFFPQNVQQVLGLECELIPRRIRSNSIINTNATTALACCALCKDTEACRSWTFSQFTRLSCYLMEDYGFITRNRTFVSGRNFLPENDDETFPLSATEPPPSSDELSTLLPHSDEPPSSPLPQMILHGPPTKHLARMSTKYPTDAPTLTPTESLTNSPTNTPTNKCAIYQWECDSGDCISRSSACDGLIDCYDESDEGVYCDVRDREGVCPEVEGFEIVMENTAAGGGQCDTVSSPNECAQLCEEHSCGAIAFGYGPACCVYEELPRSSKSELIDFEGYCLYRKKDCFIIIEGRIGTNDAINGRYLPEGEFNDFPYFIEIFGTTIYHKDVNGTGLWIIAKEVGATTVRAFSDDGVEHPADVVMWMVFDGNYFVEDPNVTATCTTSLPECHKYEDFFTLEPGSVLRGGDCFVKSKPCNQYCTEGCMAFIDDGISSCCLYYETEDISIPNVVTYDGMCTYIRCLDDPLWTSDYGKCASYAPGQSNAKFCTDDDKDIYGVSAVEACKVSCNSC